MEKYIIILDAMLNNKAIVLTDEALNDIKEQVDDRYEEGIIKVFAIEDGTIRVWSEAMDMVFDVHPDDIITDEVK